MIRLLEQPFHILSFGKNPIVFYMEADKPAMTVVHSKQQARELLARATDDDQRALVEKAGEAVRSSALPRVMKNNRSR